MDKEYIISSVNEIQKRIDNSGILDINTIDKNKTAVVIVDMINGFVKHGALSSQRALSINQPIAELAEYAAKNNIKTVCFCDTHTEESSEFEAYPVHCLENTDESKVTDEIAQKGEYILIPKNSTNGAIQPEFIEWLLENKDIDNFIVTGCCTDICVQQFALTLRAMLNCNNEKGKNVIVPVNLSETYTLAEHQADIINLFSFYNMMTNGIKIVKELKF